MCFANKLTLAGLLNDALEELSKLVPAQGDYKKLRQHAAI
jgi:hypothetical protein